MGLGNKGSIYEGTPHNIGFDVARELIDRWGLSGPKKKFNGLLYSGRAGFDGEHVAVLLPQTFMNESGKSAGPARGSLKVPLDRVLVVHDEIDLGFADVRHRLGGGLAGHNGLKSLKRELGSADFMRIRVGVGRPDSTDQQDVSSFVLGPFRQSKTEVAQLIKTTADLAEDLVRSP